MSKCDIDFTSGIKIKMKTKVIKYLLATSLLSGITCQIEAAPQPTTFVHLFEWSWQDVTQEREDYLGPKNYLLAHFDKWLCYEYCALLLCSYFLATSNFPSPESWRY